MKVNKRQVLEAVIRKSLIGENIDLKQFPNPLPKDMSGEAFLSKGLKDGDKSDDVVSAGGKQIPAATAKPSQSAIYLGKALGMAVGGIKGGNLNALISADNYILDGHHRWAATMFSDPSAAVGGTGIDMPMAQLIPVLRAAGDAYGNARRGEPGGGDVNIFKASVDDAKKAIQKIDGGTKYTKPGAAVKWLQSIGGEKELANRLEAIKAKGSEAGSAPPRAEMPVIDADKGEDQNIATRLNKGAIDIKPPYAGNTNKNNKETIPMGMKEQQGFKTTHDEDGDLLYVLPVQLTGDINADVQAMWQNDEIANLLWGELGSDEGITDEAGQHIYWGSDVQDIVQGLHEGVKTMKENKRESRRHNERYGLLMERMLGIKPLNPINAVGSRVNWLFEDEEDSEIKDHGAEGTLGPEESFLSAQEAEKEKEKSEEGGNYSDSEIEKLMKHLEDPKND